jgi:hypothetical protein
VHFPSFFSVSLSLSSSLLGFQHSTHFSRT